MKPDRTASVLTRFLASSAVIVGLVLSSQPVLAQSAEPNDPLAAQTIDTDQGTVRGGTFTDDDGSIFEGAIEAIAAAGITQGCNPPANTRYCPEDLVTRAQMAVFLVRAFGYSDSGGGDLFADDDGLFYEKAADRLKTAGVTQGCNPPANTLYCGERYVARREMAAFLVRAMGLVDDGGGNLFIDDDDSIFEAAIDRFGTAGITQGCNPPLNDRFCPNSFVTRGQMASFLARALGLTSFPTVGSTGPRVGYSAMTGSGSVTTTRDGQVIERMDIRGRLTIQHDNVVVRDSRIQYTDNYGVYVIGENGGPCPTGTLLEYVEIDGTLSSDDMIPLYSPGCEWTLDRAYVHDIGRTVRLVRNNTVTNSYILANHGGDSGSHRGAIGLNGGDNHVIRNNWLVCDTPSGCSAALAMYGDVAPIEDVLVEHNFMAATAAYCAYGGSVDSKPHPDASNVRFINNHFSKMLFPDCGRSGPITALDRNVRGNVWEGNIWHETGQPIP